MLDIIHHIKIDISRGKRHNLRRYLIRPAFPTVLECIRHAAVRSKRTGRQRTGWKGDKWKQPGLLPSQGKTTVLTQNPVGIGSGIVVKIAEYFETGAGAGEQRDLIECELVTAENVADYLPAE